MSNYVMFSNCPVLANEGTSSTKNMRANSFNKNHRPQHGPCFTNCSHKSNQGDEQIAKHPFLKKNSTQFLASFKCKNGQKRSQQKQKTSITPILKSERQNRVGSFNRTNSLKGGFTPQSLSKIDSNHKNLTQQYNQLCKIKTQALAELSEQSLQIILKEKDILCPPESKLESNKIEKNTQSLDRTKVQSFRNFFNREEDNLSNIFGGYKKNNENINSMNRLNLSAENKVNQSFLQKQSIQICPQLFYLYRTQTLISQTDGETFCLRSYSKGRKQLKYGDGTIQVYYNNGSEIKLTRWTNGDFKLIEGDKVSYWSEQLADLDQYFLD